MNLKGYATWKAFADAVAQSVMAEYVRLLSKEDTDSISGMDDDKVTASKVEPYR